MAKHKIAYAASAAALVVSALPVGAVNATNVSDAYTFSDKIGGLTKTTKTYDQANDITTVNATVVIDDAAIETVLNQTSGVGSYPGYFYAEVNPGFGMNASKSNPIYKCYASYYNDGMPTTKEGIKAEVLKNDECATESGWRSENDAFWPPIMTVEYWTDEGWKPAYKEKTEDGEWVNYKVDGDAHPAVSIRERLLTVLNLETESELAYGRNWRVSALSYGQSWVYSRTYDEGNAFFDTAEYFTLTINTETAFSYAGTDDNEHFVRYDSLEDALKGPETTVVLNKDTTVSNITIPADKTLKEGKGTLTISGLEESHIYGSFIKKDGGSYHIARVVNTGAKGNGLAMGSQGGLIGLVKAGESIVNAGGVVTPGYKSKVTINGEPADEKYTMPDEDAELVAYWYLETLYGGDASVQFAEPLAEGVELKIEEKEPSAELIEQDADIKFIYDITLEKDGEAYQLEDGNELTITMYFESEEEYKSFQVAYIKDGVIMEYIDPEDAGEVTGMGASTEDEAEGETAVNHRYYITFKVDHLSEFAGLASAGDIVSAENKNNALGTPDTGAFTGAGVFGKSNTTALVATVVTMLVAAGAMEVVAYKKRQARK